jgi:hypothetical protein
MKLNELAHWLKIVLGTTSNSTVCGFGHGRHIAFESGVDTAFLYTVSCLLPFLEGIARIFVLLTEITGPLIIHILYAFIALRI